MTRPTTRIYPHPEIETILNGTDLTEDYSQEIRRSFDKLGEYEREARRFLWDTRTALRVSWVRCGPMGWDAEKPVNRDIYSFWLRNAKGSYSSEFGASLNDTRASKFPTAYDLLACLDGKSIDYYSDIDDMAEQCGITTPSRAIEVWEHTAKESKALASMFTEDELTRLAEIN